MKRPTSVAIVRLSSLDERAWKIVLTDDNRNLSDTVYLTMEQAEHIAEAIQSGFAKIYSAFPKTLDTEPEIG